ncbi:cytochrome P450 [Citrobacter youngae]|uniref:cytochrome P450 n=1 Tax=Citrobacter youngae TaxID=133448 RepID=UPI0039B5A0BC
MNTARFFLNLASLPNSVSHYESEQGHAYLVSGLDEVRMVLEQHSDFSCPSHPYRCLYGLLSPAGCKWLGITSPTIDSRVFIQKIHDFFKTYSGNLALCEQSINSGIPISEGFYLEVKTMYLIFSLKLLFDFDLKENATEISQASCVIEELRARFGFSSPPDKYKYFISQERVAKRIFNKLAKDIQTHCGKKPSDTITHAIQETILNAVVPLAYTFIWAILLLGRDEHTQYKILQQRTVTNFSRASLLRGPCIAAIKETLRLYPPAWALGRTCTNVKTLGGHVINPGDAVIISPYALHRMRSYWDKPGHFFSSRFESNCLKQTSFIPFGAGGRICPAAQWNEIILVKAVGYFIERYSFNTKKFPREKPLVALRPDRNFALSIYRR